MTLAERVLEAERDAATLRIRIQGLATDRRRIFSEHFAAPMRPARAAWFDAWRGVADASDVVIAARSLEDAGAAFQEMGRVAACWLASATDWVGRVRVYCPTNTCPVGQDAIDMPPHYPGVGEDEVGRWRRDCGEFAVWAISLGSAGPLLAMPDRMPLATHIPADGPVSRGVQLLRLTACPTTAASFVELLGVWGAIGWLGGLSAALAVSVAPPPEGHEFRAVDLPADDGQRVQADHLLRLAISAHDVLGWIENFRRTHTDSSVVPAPSAPSNATTELAIITEEVERPTIGLPAQSVAGEPGAINPESIRTGQEFAAIAMLKTVGLNVTKIAKLIGLKRQALYRMPTFRAAIRHMKAERQQATDRLSGNVHGRDASRIDDPDDD